jgi:hypothetical protein
VIPQAPTSIRPTNEQSVTSYFYRKVWRRGVRIRRDDVVDLYLRHRGVGMDLYPPSVVSQRRSIVRPQLIETE